MRFLILAPILVLALPPPAWAQPAEPEPALRDSGVWVLVGRASDPDSLFDDAEAAMRELVGRGDTALPDLGAIIGSPAATLPMRRQALYIVARIGGPRATDILGEVLQSADEPELRHLVVTLLANLDNDAAWALVMDAAFDPSLSGSAVWALVGHPVPGSERALTWALSSGIEPVLATEALGALGTDEAMRGIAEAFESPDVTVRAAAIAMMARAVGTPAADHARDLIAGADDGTLRAAVRSLLRSAPPPETVAGLVDAVVRPEGETQWPLLDMLHDLAVRAPELLRETVRDAGLVERTIDLGVYDTTLAPVVHERAVAVARVLGLAEVRRAAAAVLDGAVQGNAAAALEILGPPRDATEVSAMVHALELDPELVAAAFAALGRAAAAGLEAAEDAISERLGRDEGPARLEAIAAAWRGGTPRLMDLVRPLTVQALGAAKDGRAVSLLADALSRRPYHEGVRRAMLGLLRRDPAAAAPIVDALGGSHDASAAGALMAAAARTDGAARRNLIRALGLLGGPDVERFLFGIARDESDPDRMSAAAAIGRVRSPSVGSYLIELLASPDDGLFLAVADGLEERPLALARPILLRRLAERQPEVAIAAARGLLALGEDREVEALVRERLSAMPEGVRRGATGLLGGGAKPPSPDAQTAGALPDAALALGTGETVPLLELAAAARPELAAYLRKVLEADARDGPVAPAILEGLHTWEPDVRRAAHILLLAAPGPRDRQVLQERLRRGHPMEPRDLLMGALRELEGRLAGQACPTASMGSIHMNENWGSRR